MKPNNNIKRRHETVCGVWYCTKTRLREERTITNLMWKSPTEFGKKQLILVILLLRKLQNSSCTKTAGLQRFKSIPVEICTLVGSRERGILDNGGGFVMKKEHKNNVFNMND